MDENRMVFARAAARSHQAARKGDPRRLEKGIWPPVTTRPRPAPHSVFAHLFFPCSAAKAPDNSLFRSSEIPCSAPDPACKRQVAKSTT